LISEQKVLKASRNRYFYGFSTLRNQQVAGSSPATSSRNPRKSKDFRGFSLLYVRFFRQQNRLTHTVTHTAKCPESGGEDVCLILSAALCFQVNFFLLQAVAVCPNVRYI